MVYKVKTVIDSDNIYGFDGLYNKDTEMAINSKNVKCINNHDEFNVEAVCFNYALPDNFGWIMSCEEGYEILEEKYKQINIRQAKKGDIVSYHELVDYIENDEPYDINTVHFAIIKETKGTLKSIIIKSKWGHDGVFETNLFDVPDAYGNAIVIWRLIKK